MPKKTTKRDTLKKPINRTPQAHVALISKDYAGHVNRVDRTHKNLHKKNIRQRDVRRQSVS